MAEPGGRIWHEQLAERELQIIDLISQGYSNREIAQRLSLSLDTIKWYNKQLYSKLGVSSRTQAASAAQQYGLLDRQPSATDNTDPNHNLPHIPTSFIGRQRELAEVKHLLQSSRLVVLTGTGGSGKTRLALQVARELVGYYPDGVWLVELAPIGDPSMVPNAIADVLRVDQSGEAPLGAIIQHFLQPRRLLLVLDNFEHLLEAAPLVGELVSSAARISVLVTSRERLNVYGEQEYPLHPLALPEPVGIISLDELMQVESAKLFVERARAVKQDFALRPHETDILARMCVHLDGLPLALELAASRLKMFTLTALDERLGDRMSLLTGGARDLPARQRTLRDTIDWSYNLLEGGERALFARLAVFRGGGTLDAIEGICGKSLPGDHIVILSSLVDKSLVRTREGTDGELRFEMLETIREYALERLDAVGELDRYNHKHADYYAQLSERAASEIRYAKQAYWFARMRSEYDNLRAALTWSLNSVEIEPGLRITAALRDFWWYSGILSEYRHWAELALERMPGAPIALQAGVMVSAGQLDFLKQGPRKGENLLLQAIDLYEQLGDERRATWSRMYLSVSYFDQVEKHQRGYSLCLGSLETFRRIDDLAGQAQALNILGEYTRLWGELDISKGYYEQCLELVAQTGEKLREGMLYANLGFIAYRQGYYMNALNLMREFLCIAEELRNDYGLLTAIASMSGPLAALGQPERAARLLAAAETQMEVIGSAHQETDLPEIEGYKLSIYSQLGDEAFQVAWEDGSRMTVKQMLALALEEVPEA